MLQVTFEIKIYSGKCIKNNWPARGLVKSHFDVRKKYLPAVIVQSLNIQWPDKL